MVTTADLDGLIGAATAFARRGVLRNRHAAPQSNPRSLPDTSGAPSPNDQPQLNDALHTKMTALLDRSLEQSTSDSRLELYGRILDQLVADEARIVRALSAGTGSPLINVYSQPRWWSLPRAVVINTSLIGRTAGVTLQTMVPTYVANLLQLGLVEIGPRAGQSEPGYEVLMAEPSVMRALAAADAAGHSTRVEQLSLQLSDLGRQLWATTMGSDSPRRSH